MPQLATRMATTPGEATQGHTRDFIDILQALLTPLVALIVVGIAFAQWWTARNRLKLDLV